MCSVKQIVEYVSWEENMLSESIGIEYDFDINYKLEKGITDLTWFTENIFCLCYCLLTFAFVTFRWINDLTVVKNLIPAFAGG